LLHVSLEPDLCLPSGAAEHPRLWVRLAGCLGCSQMGSIQVEVGLAHVPYVSRWPCLAHHRRLGSHASDRRCLGLVELARTYLSLVDSRATDAETAHSKCHLLTELLHLFDNILLLLFRHLVDFHCYFIRHDFWDFESFFKSLENGRFAI